MATMGSALLSAAMTMSLRNLLAMALLLGGLAGCDEEPAESVEEVRVASPEGDSNDEDAPAHSSLEGVELGGMDDDARELWVEEVNDLLSPCGDPISVAECVASGSECSSCLPAAQYLARLAASGYSSVEIRDMYRDRYDEDTALEIDIEGAPVRGALMGAEVTIVEFSDFECPYCGRAHPLISRALREFEGRVRLVFKHYPLSGHENAQPAARAAIAAMRQGKFWEMHDMLFENQLALTASDLESYARRLGLDVERFRRDMEDDETQALIDRNRREGRDVQVRGTPSIFVNGRRFSGLPESLPAYLREELAAR